MLRADHRRVSAENSGGSASKPPPGKPFAKGDPRINRAGRRPISKELRLLIRNDLSKELLHALVDLVQQGGKDVSTRGRLGLELADKFFGKGQSQGWAGLAVDAPPLDASGLPSASGTDLSDELRTARQRHADLVKQVESHRANGEQPSSVLHRQELEAADLVRRLVRAQAAVNPGGDAKGDFNVTVEIAADPKTDAEVPNLVADKQEAPPPPIEEPPKPAEPKEDEDDDD